MSEINLDQDPKWHNCDLCIYKTKNHNGMRVHLRTQHKIYYCGYCRSRWDKKEKWRIHMKKDCRKDKNNTTQ